MISAVRHSVLDDQSTDWISAEYTILLGVNENRTLDLIPLKWHSDAYVEVSVDIPAGSAYKTYIVVGKQTFRTTQELSVVLNENKTCTTFIRSRM